MFDLTAIIGSISILSAATLGWFTYRRSVRVDESSERTGIASSNVAGTAQAFEGLKKTIDAMNTYITVLENDRKVAKEDVKLLTQQRDALQKELNRMYRKYGENGNGNGAPAV